MAKTASFGVLHFGIAFSVTYALTGSFQAAGAVTLIEPVCNIIAHYFFDRWWERREARRAAGGQGAQAFPSAATAEAVPAASPQPTPWSAMVALAAP